MQVRDPSPASMAVNQERREPGCNTLTMMLKKVFNGNEKFGCTGVETQMIKR